MLTITERSADASTTNPINLIVAKVAAYSLLYFVIAWTGRTYKSLGHNVIVNRHRANASETFMVFAESAADDQTTNAVLPRTRKAIFMPQSTGYSHGESDGPPTKQIVEIVK